jgi:hypothetical protein
MSGELCHRTGQECIRASDCNQINDVLQGVAISLELVADNDITTQQAETVLIENIDQVEGILETQLYAGRFENEITVCVFGLYMSRLSDLSDSVVTGGTIVLMKQAVQDTTRELISGSPIDPLFYGLRDSPAIDLDVGLIDIVGSVL